MPNTNWVSRSHLAINGSLSLRLNRKRKGQSTRSHLQSASTTHERGMLLSDRWRWRQSNAHKSPVVGAALMPAFDPNRTLALRLHCAHFGYLKRLRSGLRADQERSWYSQRPRQHSPYRCRNEGVVCLALITGLYRQPDGVGAGSCPK